jgi:hypothetical protein
MSTQQQKASEPYFFGQFHLKRPPKQFRGDPLASLRQKVVANLGWEE